MNAEDGKIVARREPPDGAAARELIAELDAVLQPQYPPESRHGFSVERLLSEEVAFFVVTVGELPAACGGVLIVPGEHAELKRMYVRPAFRGRGLGKLLVERLSGHAADQGLHVLRLETGIHQVEAIGLYTSLGFERIPPFGPYFDDPVSICMEKRLASA